MKQTMTEKQQFTGFSMVIFKEQERKENIEVLIITTI